MHVAILGNGIAGVSAAIRLRQRQPDWRITLISGESDYHYSRPALMYIFMGHMSYRDTKPYEDHFWEEQRIDRIRGWVTGIDFDAKTLHLHQRDDVPYDKLLLATGSKPNRFGWPGQDLPGVQGLYGLQDLRLLYDNIRHARRAVIVGGGLIGIELAEMVHSRGVGVTFVIREGSYWNSVLPDGESAMVSREIASHGMELVRSTNLQEILPGPDGRVRAITTDTGREIECQLVGLTPGVSPNLDLVKDSDLPTDRGILVDSSLRTRIPDVYAAGDCAEIRTGGDDRNLLQQVWYTGKMQGNVVGDVMAGHQATYDPGIWYNSAKFLDLEYQTYGRVGFKVPGEDSLYWEHPEGKHSVRIVHVDGTVIGFNFMGLRNRHRVCERWIAEERRVEEILPHLADANFDPEFFARFEPQIRSAMQEQLSP